MLSVVLSGLSDTPPPRLHARFDAIVCDHEDPNSSASTSRTSPGGVFFDAAPPATL